MSRINYPETWPQSSRDALDALFAEARAKGLWFFHNSLAAGPLWFSPNELETQQKAGKFVWGADNWKLLPPSEYAMQLEMRITDAQAAHQRFLARMKAE